MLRPCNSALRLLAAAIGLVCAAAAARADIALTPRDAAIVRLNVVDLLAKEPRLPLPIKQRRAVLEAYYHTGNGALLWLGSKRAGALVARLLAADKEGLDPKDYNGKALAEVNQESSTLDKRKLAIAELYFSAAFLAVRLRPAGRPRAAEPGRSRFLSARRVRSTSSPRSEASRRRRASMSSSPPSSPTTRSIAACARRSRITARWPPKAAGQAFRSGPACIPAAPIRACRRSARGLP